MNKPNNQDKEPVSWSGKTNDYTVKEILESKLGKQEAWEVLCTSAKIPKDIEPLNIENLHGIGDYHSKLIHLGLYFYQNRKSEEFKEICDETRLIAEEKIEIYLGEHYFDHHGMDLSPLYTYNSNSLANARCFIDDVLTNILKKI